MICINKSSTCFESIPLQSEAEFQAFAVHRRLVTNTIIAGSTAEIYLDIVGPHLATQRRDDGGDPRPSTLNPQYSTHNPQSSTLNPQPSTLNPQPSTLDPQSSTLDYKPYTLIAGSTAEIDPNSSRLDVVRRVSPQIAKHPRST